MTDLIVVEGRLPGSIAFLFMRELSAKEARAFHDDIGVWPVHTVDGERRATKPCVTEKP